MTPLAELLDLALPSPQEASLLRACLLADEAARLAWRRWVAGVGDPRSAIAGRPELLLLLPILHEALSRAGIDAGELMSHLRIVALRERRRSQAVSDVMAEVGSLLVRAEIRPTLTGGLALASTAYAEPGLRHCHDIDLLLRREDMGRALATLAGVGFVEDDGAGAPDATRRAIAPSGLAVLLHPVSGRPSVAANGASWSIATPEMLLLRIVSRAADGGSRRLLRIADAAMLLRRAGPSFDWALLISDTTARAWSLRALATLTTLDAIVGELVPPSVLAELQHRGRLARAAERDAVLGSLRTRGALAGPTLWSHASRRSRLDLVRSALWPSRSYLESIGQPSSPGRRVARIARSARREWTRRAGAAIR